MTRFRLLCLAALLWSGAAFGQAFPVRPVRIVVPFPPAGAVDILARVVGQKLGDKWKQGVVVENRPGGGTVLGTDIVAKSAADGYTLLLAVTAHAVNATLVDKLPFDPVKDFATITLAATAPNILVVSPSVPANNVAELIAYAKANPGKLNFGSPGSGTAMHLSGEMFKTAAGISVVHVPYKGTQPVITALLAGEVSYTFDAGVSLAHVKAGKLRAFAVTSAKRAAIAPELPTMAEAGLPGFEAQSWYGFLAPAGTPVAVVELLSRDINETLRDPEVRARIATAALEPVGTTPAEFEQYLKADIIKWGRVVKASGAKVD
ncbi:MAG: tripartite tricarboxylate transporter substrate binding protein [Proteobacteria bacterium]|nr:tripartite tricarboxylate transporter substrate binding protein [Pseudomonadota bacterium]